jgi:hypothetical protein
LRHGRQPLRPEEEQVDQEDKDDFRRAHGASRVAASKGTYGGWGRDPERQQKAPLGGGASLKLFLRAFSL